jgi:hypothetical protein
LAAFSVTPFMAKYLAMASTGFAGLRDAGLVGAPGVGWLVLVAAAAGGFTGLVDALETGGLVLGAVLSAGFIGLAGATGAGLPLGPAGLF